MPTKPLRGAQTLPNPCLMMLREHQSISQTHTCHPETHSTISRRYYGTSFVNGLPGRPGAAATGPTGGPNALSGASGMGGKHHKSHFARDGRRQHWQHATDDVVHEQSIGVQRSSPQPIQRAKVLVAAAPGVALCLHAGPHTPNRRLRREQQQQHARQLAHQHELIKLILRPSRRECRDVSLVAVQAA